MKNHLIRSTRTALNYKVLQAQSACVLERSMIENSRCIMRKITFFHVVSFTVHNTEHFWHRIFNELIMTDRKCWLIALDIRNLSKSLSVSWNVIISPYANDFVHRHLTNYLLQNWIIQVEGIISIFYPPANYNLQLIFDKVLSNYLKKSLWALIRFERLIFIYSEIVVASDRFACGTNVKYSYLM